MEPVQRRQSITIWIKQIEWQIYSEKWQKKQKTPTSCTAVRVAAQVNLKPVLWAMSRHWSIKIQGVNGEHTKPELYNQCERERGKQKEWRHWLIEICHTMLESLSHLLQKQKYHNRRVYMEKGVWVGYGGCGWTKLTRQDHTY